VTAPKPGPPERVTLFLGDEGQLLLEWESERGDTSIDYVLASAYEAQIKSLATFKLLADESAKGWAAAVAEREKLRLDVARLEARIQSLTDLGEVVARDVARLEEEVTEMKEGYHRLDVNWSSMHTMSIDAICSALGMPDASIPAMVQAIKEINFKLSAVMDRNWEEESEYYRHERSTPLRLAEWVRAKLGVG
jgi:hypothetical protein